MKFHGIQLEQGSNVANLTVASGTAFPDTPHEGEMFFRSDTDVRVKGLYMYSGGNWDRVASTDTLTVPNGLTLPSLANEGDLFYFNSGDITEGLYIYKAETWINLTAGSAPAYNITGDVSGTIDGGIDSLVLGNTGVSAGSYGSGTQTITLTVDSKGRLTAVSAVASTPSFANITGKPSTLAGYGISDGQPLDTDLTAFADLSTTGLVTRTGSGTAATRSIAVSGNGLTVTNASGVAGDPTVVSNATNANTPSTIVYRDASGNFAAGTITASLTGAASQNVLKSGDTMTSGANLTFVGGGTVTGLPFPTNLTDAVSKQYLETQISESIPAGQIGQIPFILTDGTNTTELGYSMVKGQFIESDTELTDAYTRITSNATIFAEWSRFSHISSLGGTLTRTSGVSRFQFGSANLSTLSAAFTVGSTILVASTANPSFSGTFTITAVSNTGSNHVVFYSQAGEPDVGTGVAGTINRDSVQPAISSEITSWAYDSINDVISTTVNSDSYIGFISQQRYADYEHEVVLRSTNSDDDTIGVILAWAVDNTGREYTLSALRSTGGNNFTWRVVYNYGRSDAVVIQDKTDQMKWGNGAYGANWTVSGYSPNQALGGWDDFSTVGTRVKAIRTGDTITVQASDLGETTYVAGSTITVDLTSAAYLEKFRGPREIGYSALSQASASFEVIAFSDNLNVIYDVRDGDVYEYDGSSWVLQGTTDLITEIGYGRLLFNPYTNKTYYTSFDDQGVIKIGETGADRVLRTGDDMTGKLTITVNSATDALRVTQAGSGDALRVEDAANPDSTPFLVKGDGRVIIGGEQPQLVSSSIHPLLQTHTNSGNIGIALGQWGADTVGSATYFLKTRGTSAGVQAAVTAGDALGSLVFEGSDGTDYARGGALAFVVDGTVATDSVPTRFVLSTTAAAGTTPTERLRITSAGAWGLSGPNFGTAGQVLTSAGSGAPPTWSSVTTGTVTSIDVATSGVGISASGGPVTSSGTITITSNATSSNVASSIVARDVSGGFTAGNIAISSFVATGLSRIDAPTAPQFEFREGDQTLPAGRWRLVVDNDIFSLRHNTAAAGDFSTFAYAWQANANNSVSFPAGVASTSTTSGTIIVTGGAGFSGAVYASSFNGSGSGLTALNATQLTTGTIPDARIASTGVTQHQTSLTITESQITDGTLLARNAGNETISGTWTFSNPVTVGTPTADGHAATKLYVDNVAAGVNPHAAVRVATTANITLSGTQTIDGIAVVAGDRVLVKDQTTASQNGVYIAAAGAWTRATDFDGNPSSEVTTGDLVFVDLGTTWADTSWVVVTSNPITVGTTAITFSLFSRAGDLTAGAGLTKTGNTINIGTASASRIVVNADTIDLASTGVGNSTFNRVSVDDYGRVTNGTNLYSGTGTTMVTNTAPSISNATLTGTITLPDNATISSWSATNTDIDGLISGSTFGTLVESFPSGHFTIGLRSNDVADGFQIVSKGNAATPSTDPYNKLAFEVKQTGDTTVGGALTIAGATTMNGALTINDLDNQLILRRTANQYLVIENNGTATQPVFTSFSDPGIAKAMVFRVTTDDANTALTGGSLGFNFQVYSSNVFLVTGSGISWAGTASGNGSGITALSGTNIATGTVADARLSSNVALRNSTNSFSTYQNIQIATAGTNQEYLRLTPTDYTANKPYLAIKTTTSSADRWQMLLWDGADSNGTIAISASSVELGSGTANVYSTGSLAAVTSVSAGTQFLTLGTDTLASPGYSWTGDNNTGFYRPAADTIAVVTGATERMRFSSTGTVGVGIVPTYGKFEVRIGEHVANLPLDGIGIRAGQADGLGSGWLAGIGMESDASGIPTVALYSPNATTAAANSVSRAFTVTGSATSQYLRLYSGGEVERLRIAADGGWGLGGANYGTSGQVLTSNGSGSAPTWQSITITTGSFADGSAASPSITFAADTNTGIYRPTADQVGITTGGTLNTLFTTSGVDIAGALAVGSGASISSNSAIYSSQTYSADVTRYGYLGLFTIDNTVALTADRSYLGSLNRMTLNLQNGLAFSPTVRGAQNEAVVGPAGGSSVDGEGELTGSYNYANHTSADLTYNRVENIYGSYNYGLVSGATAIGDQVYGSYNLVNASSATSVINTAYGQRSRVQAGIAGATVTNAYVFYGDMLATGTITNRYGLFIPTTSIYNFVGGGFQVGGTSQTAGSTGIPGLGVGVAPSGTAGTIVTSGTISAGTQFLSPTADTVSTPGFSWVGNTNTGIYHPAANEVAITTNGTEAIRVNAVGAIGLAGANYGTSGQVLRSNGSGAAASWANVGSVTSVAIAGNDGISIVSGSPITSSGTITLGLGAITPTSVTVGTGTNGKVGLVAGGASNSGYIQFMAHTSGTRQGYIGFSGTNATADTGTIPYVAGTHAFTGAITGTGAISTGGTITGAELATAITGATGTTRLYINSPTGQTAAIARFMINGTDVASISAAGVVTAAGFTGPLTGNASTATTLQTARTINGVSFNGSANITVTANTPQVLTFNNSGAGGGSGTTFSGAAATVSYNTIGAAPTASPTFTGTVTAPILRLTTTTDASLTSTGHAFQIGADAGANIIMDGNEIMARNAGAAAPLNFNLEGGGITLGSSATEVTVPGNLVCTNDISVGAGTVSAPSLRFAGDADTGFYSVANTSVSLAIAGVNELTVSGGLSAFGGKVSCSSSGLSVASWTTSGCALQVTTGTTTDNSSAASATVASRVAASISTPTFAATNTGITVTNAATLYIAGAPAAGTNTTITNSYALWIDAGEVRLDGVVNATANQAATSTTTGSIQVTGGIGLTGALYAGGEVTAFSDRRVKGDFQVITDAVAKVEKVSGYTYVRTDLPEENGKRHAGVIAQEIEEILPEVVTTDPETGMKGVAYGNMVALLIEATKEMSAQIKQLQAEIAELKGAK